MITSGGLPPTQLRAMRLYARAAAAGYVVAVVYGVVDFFLLWGFFTPGPVTLAVLGQSWMILVPAALFVLLPLGAAAGGSKLQSMTREGRWDDSRAWRWFVTVIGFVSGIGPGYFVLEASNLLRSSGNRKTSHKLSSG